MNEEEISAQVAMILTWVLTSVLCQIINIIGMITNIINIICFAMQGFSDSVNVSLLVLSVSDLGSLLTMFGTCICITPTVAAADLSFEPMEVMYLSTGMPHVSFTRVSSCITAMITLERCLCVIAPLKIKRVITPRRTTGITIVLFFIVFFSGAPVYAVNKLGKKYSPFRNKTLVGLISTDDRERVEGISFTINNVIIPLSTFAIIVVCAMTLSIQLQNQTRWRKTTNSSQQIDNVSTRNQKIGKMVVMISTVFIVCFVPVCATALAIIIVPEMSVNGKYINVTLCLASIGYTLESINSSMNIFIYYHMSSKYRDTLRKMCRTKKTCCIDSTDFTSRHINSA